jgi:type IV pilus assembly protein PilY1
MKKQILLTSILSAFSLTAFAAPQVSPSNVPLESGGIQGPKPSIMFVFDNSDQMKKSYVADEVVGQWCKGIGTRAAIDTQVNYQRNCIADKTQQGMSITAWPNDDIQAVKDDDEANKFAPDAPYMSSDFNKLYYNPSVSYNPPVLSDGTSLPNSSITAAKINGYSSYDGTSSDTKNLNTGLNEIYFCTKKVSPNLTTDCKRNGVDNVTVAAPTFNYYAATTYPDATYKYPYVVPTTSPFYYKIVPNEFCSADGVTCMSSTTANTPIPMRVRWCDTEANATANGIISGKNASSLPKCQQTYDANHTFPRWGNFQRYTINTAAELTNFANWFTYYRTRLSTLKTSTSLAFNNISSNNRIGFITTNPASPFGTNDFVPAKSFDSDQQQKFYNALFAQTTKAGSRLREALSRVGRYYAGVSTGISAGMIDPINEKPDPVKNSCQQNFAVLGTSSLRDSSDAGGQDIDGNIIGNVDNTDLTIEYTNRISGAYDGNLSGSSGTLADVAMYYYKTDLRTSGLLNKNNVPVTTNDQNTAQHLVTYAISYGLNGVMGYTDNYINGTNPDLQNIKSGIANACSWTTGTCNWTEPVANTNTTIDDLWHAAVNGRGQFFSTQNADDFTKALKVSLGAVISQTSSSAASATSSPNITSTDNFLFYTTYRTNKWDGEISAKTIDPVTGNLSATPLWSARTLLNAKTIATKDPAVTTDSRNVKFITTSGTSLVLKDLNYANMNSTEQSYFSSKTSHPTEMVNFLRGQRGYEEQYNLTNPYFRNREYILGDIVNSAPIYVGQPRYNWTDSGYSAFKTANATRTKMLFSGGNDGMIHAFDATTGEELWAIVPDQLLPNMYKLAQTEYSSNHEFFVDGSITVMDANISGTWKTILVAGLGAGGKGYVALDVTNPNAPAPLWTICTTSICKKSDSEMGLSYGNPIITKREYDDKWVVYVTSGYDNATGKGIVYELDASNGAILNKMYVGTGTAGAISSSNQVGLAKINALYENFDTNNKAKAIYGGDLNGDIWKWDLTTSSPTSGTLLGTTQDSTNKAQPITTKLEIGNISGNTILFAGTGKYLNTDDQSSTNIQSVYAIKDSNTNLGVLRSDSKIIEQNISLDGSGITSSNSTINNVNLASTDFNGWYFDLKSQSGERVNIDPILAVGTLNVIGNVPATSQCTAGGDAWYYQINYLNGGALPDQNNMVSKKLPGGFVVGQVIVKLGGSGLMKNFITDSSGNVTPGAMNVNSAVVNSGTANYKKVSWKEYYKR